MLKLLQVQIVAFFTDWRSYLSLIAPIFFMIILGSIEGEARTLATVMASSVLTFSLLRLKGAFDRFKNTNIGLRLGKDYHYLKLYFIYVFYLFIIIFFLEYSFIFAAWFFTQVLDIMNGNLIKYGDIVWTSVNWVYVTWSLVCAILINSAIAFVLYSFAAKKNQLYLTISFGLIFLCIIMNVLFADYLKINEDGVYYADYAYRWVNNIWFAFPNFWTNSIILKNFKLFHDQYVYNPFLIGNTLNAKSQLLQILYIAMPWVWYGVLMALGFGIEKYMSSRAGKKYF